MGQLRLKGADRAVSLSLSCLVRVAYGKMLMGLLVGVALVLFAAPTYVLAAEDEALKSECRAADDACDEPPCFSGSCAGYRVDEKQPKCLTSPFHANERHAKRIITIEVGNWLTAELTGQVMAILLRDVMGFKTRFLESTGGSAPLGTGWRVGEGRADMCLEYWSSGHDIDFKPYVDDGKMRKGLNGFTGSEGLFITGADKDADTSIWWDYWKSYIGEETTPTTAKLPANDRPAGVTGPRTHTTIDGTVLTAKMCGLGSKSHFDLHNSGCDQRTGQYYDEDSAFCKPDPETLQSRCHEVYAHSPSWGIDKIEAMIKRRGAPMTLVHWGSNLTKVVSDQAARGQPTLHYWWTPDPWLAKLKTLGSDPTRTSWPVPTDKCGPNTADPVHGGCDYPFQSLAKVMNSRLAANADTVAAANLYEATSWNNEVVDVMLSYHMDGGGTYSSAFDAACNFLKDHPTYQKMAENILAGLCEPGTIRQDDDGTCKICMPGQFSDSATATECSTCPAGTFSLTKARECIQCPTGHYSAPGSGECKRCEPGTFSVVANATCTACPVGHFASSYASSTCSPCSGEPGALYQDTIGASECKKCPVNTHLPLGKGGINVTECLCKEGFWRPDGLEGKACVACPANAYCPAADERSRIVMPLPERGYWAKTEKEIRPAGGDKLGSGSVEVLSGFPFARKANVPEPKVGDTDTGFELPEIHLKCPIEEQCPGRTFECSGETRDALCTRCRDGYMNLGSECVKCPDGKGSGASVMSTLMGWLIVVSVWVTMNAIAAGRHECFDIMLLFLQIVSIIQGFSVPWPSELRIVMQAFAVVNFDVDFVSPACVFSWGYVASTVLTYFLPFVWAFFNTLKLGVAHLWYKKYKNRDQEQPMYARIFRLSFFVTTKDGLKEVEYSVTRSCATVVIVIYNAICIKAFGAFICTEAADGVSFLNASPDITCGSSTHHSLIAGAVIAIAAYVIGIPAYVGYKLTSLHRNNLLSDPAQLSRWGFLYLAYEPNYWWWPLVFLARRLLFCTFLVFLHERPYLQIFLGVFFVIVFACMQYYARPFIQAQVDILESFILVVTALYMLCGAVFLSKDLLRTDEVGMTVFLLLGTGLATMFSIYIVFISVLRRIRSDRNSVKLLRHVATMWVCVSVGLRRKYKNAEALTKALDTNQDGTISATELIAFFQSAGIGFAGVLSEVVFSIVDKDNNGKLSTDEIAESLFQLNELRMEEDVDAFNKVAVTELGDFATKMIDAFDTLTIDVTDDDGESKGDYEVMYASKESVRIEMIEEAEESSKSSLRQPDDSTSSRLSKSLSFMSKIMNINDMFESASTAVLSHARVLSEIAYRERLLNATGGELTDTINADPFFLWMQKCINGGEQNLITAAALVDQWTAPHMANDSEYGAYSYSEKAIFFRQLVKSYPFVIDWLLTASEEDILKFREVKDSLFSQEQKFKEQKLYKMRIGKLIVHEDRAPFLHWLADISTEKMRSRATMLLKNIVDTMNHND